MKGIGKAACAILAVALVARLVVGDQLHDRLPAGTDELAYLTMANSVAAGEGFPDRPFSTDDSASALTSPGFAYFLGGVFAVFGDGEHVLRITAALMGTIVVGLVGLIAWQAFRRRDVAIAALAIAAIYPALLVMSATTMTEWLFLPLLLGAVAAALRTREAPSPGWAAATGALVGAAALTKTVGVIAAVVICVAIWPRPRRALASLAIPATAAALAIAVVLPWTIRNAVEFDSFVPISNESGFVLAGAYNEQSRADSDHEWLPPAQLPGLRDVIVDPALSEAEVSRELTSRALELAADNPDYPFALAFHNSARLLQARPSGPTAIDAQLLGFGNGAEAIGSFRAAYWATALAFFAVVALTIAGAVRGWLRPLPAFLVVLAVVVVAPLIFLAAGPRFRLPADVLLIVFASPAAAQLGYWMFCSMKSRRLST
jgi:4-amino-4-deoxy-L-arabinose transferase-like glycosyltransferase